MSQTIILDRYYDDTIVSPCVQGFIGLPEHVTSKYGPVCGYVHT